MRRYIKLLIFVMLISGIIFAGFLTNNYLGKANERQVNTVGRQFITHLTKGEMDQAYGMASMSLRAVQSQPQFSKNLGNLKTDQPQFLQSRSTTNDKDATYYQTVEGLPKTPSGRTDGNFTINLVKDGVSWKVSSVSVK